LGRRILFLLATADEPSAAMMMCFFTMLEQIRRFSFFIPFNRQEREQLFPRKREKKIANLNPNVGIEEEKRNHGWTQMDTDFSKKKNARRWVAFRPPFLLQLCFDPSTMLKESRISDKIFGARVVPTGSVSEFPPAAD